MSVVLLFPHRASHTPGVQVGHKALNRAGLQDALSFAVAKAQDRWVLGGPQIQTASATDDQRWQEKSL